MNGYLSIRVTSLIALILTLTSISIRLQAQTGCSPNPTPFTDLGGMSTFFCAAVFEAYFSGLTNGTSATTYSPSSNVTRDQMAAFITRTMDQSLRRGSRRAALNQWWTLAPTSASLSETINLVTTSVGNTPRQVVSDGADLWVANSLGNSISRVRASDGSLLETRAMSGATKNAAAILAAMGRIFAPVNLCSASGNLQMFDPKTPGSGTVVAEDLGDFPKGITFDGTRIWTANDAQSACFSVLTGSISIVTPGDTLPWGVIQVTTGFSNPFGILYDGSNIWVADRGDNTLKKLNSSGGIIQTIPVGSSPRTPVFDGTNIWVPNFGSNDVTVVRVKDSQGNPTTAFVLATVSAPLMSGPQTAAFDGQRILITCHDIIDAVYLFKAADLAFIGAMGTGDGTTPFGACSDGLNFWVTLSGTDKLIRF